MKESFDPSWETKMYARAKQLNRYPYGDLVSYVLRLYGTALKARKKLRVLELGSGGGNNLVFFAREGFETYGIEGSVSACAAARKLLASQSLAAKITLADFISLPFPDKHFDLIVDRESVCHNKKKAILDIQREVRRCLKPGGRFLSFAFSTNHGGIKADGGREIERGTYDGFKKGKFAPAGTTHFFTEREIKDALFRDLELEFLIHHRNDFLIPEQKNQFAEFIGCGRKP
ncbi:MAG: class I SAM-dependent methyltransferase [Elusimicrobia bacterium]|nr:class I SAM-dependent methyltransferase [Elusimicrobiota bacterium]